jgi:hypothetical protein
MKTFFKNPNYQPFTFFLTPFPVNSLLPVTQKSVKTTPASCLIGLHCFGLAPASV